MTICALTSYGQDKCNYVIFNKLTEVEGTEFVIARIENWGKMEGIKNRYLLFINTQTGQTNQVNFPNEGYFEKIEQIPVTEVTEQITSLTQYNTKGIDSVNIDFQFRGDCYAFSSAKNAEESNGEAHSDNLPNKVDKSFPRQGFYLVINQNEFSKIDSAILGCKLYLVNTTDSLIKLDASDSRLYIVAEALNDKKEWAPISYLPSSGCGNSYHTVVLDKDEYWRFDIPVFKGAIRADLGSVYGIGRLYLPDEGVFIGFAGTCGRCCGLAGCSAMASSPSVCRQQKFC